MLDKLGFTIKARDAIINAEIIDKILDLLHAHTKNVVARPIITALELTKTPGIVTGINHHNL